MRYLLTLAFCATLFASTVLADSFWQSRSTQSGAQRYHQIMKLKSHGRIAPVIKDVPVVEDEKYILVIAPHPDDEILCCTSVIREAVKNDKPLKIIYITDGDAKSNLDPQASRSYGTQRRGESVNATKLLGVKSEDLIWLGFPDSILANLREERIISPYTFRKTTAVHTYKPQLAYTRPNLDAVLSELIEKFPPEAIYFPDEEKEKHVDHIETGKVIWNLIEPQSEAFHHYRYAIHTKNAHPTPGFLDTLKLNAINLFESQFHDTEHREFLQAFSYREEIFE